jgi:hypothetical protein
MVGKSLRDRLHTLSTVATQIRHHHASIQDAATTAKDALLSRRLTVTGPALSCSVLPLRAAGRELNTMDIDRLRDVTRDQHGTAR